MTMYDDDYPIDETTPKAPLLDRRWRIAIVAGFLAPSLLLGGFLGVRRWVHLHPLNVGTTQRVVLHWSEPCGNPENVVAFGVTWVEAKGTAIERPTSGDTLAGSLYRVSRVEAQFRGDDGQLGTFGGLVDGRLSTLSCSVR